MIEKDPLSSPREEKQKEKHLTSHRKVVAFARWKYPAARPAAEYESAFEDIKLPEGTNVPLCEAMFGAFGAITKKYPDPEKMYCMKIPSPFVSHCPGRQSLRQNRYRTDINRSSYLHARSSRVSASWLRPMTHGVSSGRCR